MPSLAAATVLAALFRRKKKVEEQSEDPEYMEQFVDIVVPEAERAGVSCPSCGSANLLVTRDGSALCKDCKKAYRELVPPS